MESDFINILINDILFPLNWKRCKRLVEAIKHNLNDLKYVFIRKL